MPTHNTQQIRIIGGKWRGRKINFPMLAEIRPTPDRVRETLFNWLAPHIEGAYCLDLYTGSGALGFEALSRGARHVVMVDKSPEVIEHLRAIASKLDAGEITLFQGKAPNGMILPPEVFDIIFLDPPFRQDLIQPSCEWLEKQKLIDFHTLIYIEAENTKIPIVLPENFKILKQGKTSQVVYYLGQLDI